MEKQDIQLYNLNSSDTIEYQKQLFEQYKLYVELADRTSQRRIAANNFFIAANASLLTIASWFKDNFGTYIYLISIVGIIISLFWFFLIRSYKQLNTGKFKVIHELEKKLPACVFDYEWKVLGKGKSFKNYWQISHIEMAVPFIFSFLYVAVSLIYCLKI